MTYYPRLTLRSEFEIVEVADVVTAVSVGDAARFSGVILLKNESTRFMFEKVQEGITLPELIMACMEKYGDSPVEEVGPQVIEFLDRLNEQGLLLVDTKHGMKVED